MEVIELLQAQRAIVSGMYNDALVILDSSPVLQSNPLWWHLHAIANYMRGDYRSALDDAKRAFELETLDERKYKIMYDIALIKWRLGDIQGAISDLEKLKDKLEYAVLALATFHFLLGDLDALSQLLDSVRSEVFSTPLEAYLNYYRALISIYDSALDEAYKYSLESYKLKSDFLGNILLLISLLIKAGELNRAESLIDSILRNPADELHRTYPLYFKGYIALLREPPDLELAEESLSVALRYDPENPNYWFLLGLVNLYKRRFDKANAYFKGAFVMDSTCIDYRVAYAVSEALQGELERAVKIIERADLKEVPENLRTVLDRLKEALRNLYRQ